MKTIHGACRSLFLLAVLSVALIPQFGCAAKAKAIKVGAAQFEVEASAAVDKMDTLRTRELSATPIGADKASDQFIKLVEGDQNGVSRGDLQTYLGANDLDLGGSNSKWQAFLADVRNQYTSFAAIFSSLDKGSFFARESVSKAIPILDKLIAQMAAFAKSISDDPPEFTRQRAEIAVALEDVKGDSAASTAEKKLRYLDLERRLRELTELEKQTGKEAIDQCLKTAQLGVDLKRLLQSYDQLSLDDINEALTVAFTVAGSLTGSDLSGAQAQAQQVVTDIRSDSAMTTLFDSVAGKISAARTHP